MRLLAGWFLLCAASPALPQQPAPSPEGPYDEQLWSAVRVETAQFPGTIGRANVALLRSRQPTGIQGTGAEPDLHEANLVIWRNDEVFYRWETQPPRLGRDGELRYLLKEDMQVRDVTGDGVPEVLFWSGYVGVINTAEEQHVIRYDESERRFRDVQRNSFTRGRWHDIRWVDVDGAVVAVTASGVGGQVSHNWHGYFEYGAFCWWPRSRSFVQIYAGLSSRPGESPSIGDDLPQMLPALSEPAKRVCQRSAQP